jgi:hypothetical protein
MATENPTAVLAEPVFLDTKAAATLLRLQPRTLDRWRWAGRGPQYRRHGGRVVYAMADLLARIGEKRGHSRSDNGRSDKSRGENRLPDP